MARSAERPEGRFPRQTVPPLRDAAMAYRATSDVGTRPAAAAGDHAAIFDHPPPAYNGAQMDAGDQDGHEPIAQGSNGIRYRHFGLEAAHRGLARGRLGPPVLDRMRR